MQSLRILSISLGFLLLIIFSSLSFSQEIQRINNYYPSPLGVYRQVTFFPRDPLTNCEKGTVYSERLNDGLSKLRFCADGQFDNGLIDTMTNWHMNESNVFLSDFLLGSIVDPLPYISIGSDLSPDGLLEIIGSEDDLFMISSIDDGDGDVFNVQNNGQVLIGADEIADNLNLLANGRVRAEEYCDENGENCTSSLQGAALGMSVQRVTIECKCYDPSVHGGGDPYPSLPNCDDVGGVGGHGCEANNYGICSTSTRIKVACPNDYTLIGGFSKPTPTTGHDGASMPGGRVSSGGWAQPWEQGKMRCSSRYHTCSATKLECTAVCAPTSTE